MKQLDTMLIYADIGLKGCERIGRFKTLEHVHLSGSWVKDKHLEHFEKLPKLKELVLSETKVSLKGVRRLKTKLPNVKVDVRNRL